MKSFKITAAVLLIITMGACSGGGKKILIMTSGQLTVDENDQRNIKTEPGTRHTEKEIMLDGSEKQTLTVQTAQGNKTFELSESGHYLLNLKPDTLIGGIVRYGTGDRTSNLTGEDVDHIIDSTQKLLMGQNASDDNKTYFIVPNSLKKISSETGSKIIGPYNNIPGTVDSDNSGKTPEMYKLFTNKQKRESVEELIRERKK
ncbi:MAG: hypothetical protein WKF89_07160 [Chitinophagaceae bacterium]